MTTTTYWGVVHNLLITCGKLVNNYPFFVDNFHLEQENHKVNDLWYIKILLLCRRGGMVPLKG